jgi:outer membrane protein TolC
VVVFPSVLVCAGDPVGGVLTQDQAVQLALSGNPDLRVSRERLVGIRERVRQAREYPATAIEFDFDQQVEFLHSREQYIGFTQELEFPTRVGLRVDAAEEDVRASEAEQRLSRWETALTAKAFYQDLALAQALVELSRENLAIAEQLAAMAGGKFELGIVGKLEVLRAGVERARAATDLSRLEKQEYVSRMRLNHLLGRDPEQALQTTQLARGQLDHLELEGLVRLALEHRLELKVLGRRLAGAEFQESLARSAYCPDLSFSIYRHRIDEEPNSWDIALGISVPILGLGAIAGQVAEARAEKTALGAEDDAARARIGLEVRTAYEALEELTRQVVRYRDSILAPAEEAFVLATASYAEGEIESLELLDSQRTLQTVRQELAGSVFEHNLALIDLEQAVGVDLGWEMPRQPNPTHSSGEDK